MSDVNTPPSGPAEGPYAPQHQVVGKLFVELLDDVQYLHVSHDGETFFVDITDRQDRRRRCSHERPLGLLLAALGVVGRKPCLGPCGRVRPFKDFGGDKNNPDGLLRRCKTCERVRVGLYARRKSRRAVGAADEAE